MRYAETANCERRYGLYTVIQRTREAYTKVPSTSFGAPLVGCSHLRLRWIRGTKPHSPNARSKKHGLQPPHRTSIVRENGEQGLANGAAETKL